MSTLHYISTTLSNAQNEVLSRYEVDIVLRDIVVSIEIFNSEEYSSKLEKNLEEEHCTSNQLNIKLTNLQEENKQLQKRMAFLINRAVSVRESLVTDIGELLLESQGIHKLHKRVKELEFQVYKSSSLENELDNARQRILQLENAMLKSQNKENSRLSSSFDASFDTSTSLLNSASIYSTLASSILTVNEQSNQRVDNKQKKRIIFLDLEDEFILHTFSYLEAMDVMSTAQICRSFFRRIDVIFGIESQILRDSWQQEIPVTSTQEHSPPLAVKTNVTPEPVMTGKAQIDSIIQKLTGTEKNVVLDLYNNLQSKSKSLEAAETEREDLNARVQSAERVRDFLVDKLREAELALKSSLDSEASLLQQSSIDNEVIQYLDCRATELDNALREETRKCGRLSAALDLRTQQNNDLSERLRALDVQDRTRTEEDSSAKQHKRVLVKEVRSLRRALADVSADRDDARKQLQAFRDILDGRLKKAS